MKIRILDLSLSVKKALRALPYPKYLAAMWVIASELAEAYRDRNSPEGADLADRSLAILRTTVGEGREAGKADAGSLKLEWFSLTGVSVEGYDDEAPPFELPVDPGVGNFWWVVRDLMAELDTGTYLYSALTSLTLAVTMIEDSPADVAGHIESTGQTADEEEAGVQMLRKCRTVVELVGRADDHGLRELDSIREAVFNVRNS